MYVGSCSCRDLEGQEGESVECAATSFHEWRDESPFMYAPKGRVGVGVDERGLDSGFEADCTG